MFALLDQWFSFGIPRTAAKVMVKLMQLNSRCTGTIEVMVVIAFVRPSVLINSGATARDIRSSECS